MDTKNIEKQTIKNILAISTTGMGNAILYTPVLRVLRHTFPDSKITLLVGSKTTAEILRGTHFIDEVIIYHRNHSLFGFYKFIVCMRRKKFDMVITSFLDKSFKVALFSLLTKASYRVGFAGSWFSSIYTHRVPVVERKHEIEYNLDLVRALEIPVRREKEKRPSLELSALEIELADDFLTKNNVTQNALLVGIHPGSGLAAGEAKRWPLEKFAHLADLLQSLPRVKVVIFGGPEEKKLSDTMARSMDKTPLVTAAALDIRATAALIKKCRLFISNDSGLMHVATAVKTPVLALFGPTLWWKNYPWGKENVVVRRKLKCSPCYRYRPITCADRRCLTGISTAEVLYKAKEMLGMRRY